MEHVMTDTSGITDEVLAFLPAEICIAVGRTIELYNKQVAWCGNVANFHFKWQCAVGKSMGRKWTCTATEGMIGAHPMTLSVLDNNMTEVARVETTVKIVTAGADIPTPRKFVAIGDSLTNNKPWYQEWLNLSEATFGKPVLQFLGTRGGQFVYKHEGRSGYASKGYVTDSSYGYEGNYHLTVSCVTTPPTLKKRYSIYVTWGGYVEFEVESYDLTDGAGTIDVNRLGGGGDISASGVMTGIDAGVDGDATIAYSSAVCTTMNPFWNPATGAVDFANYSAEHGITPDEVIIYLGANELSLDPSNTVANIRTLVTAVKRDWHVPIYLVFTGYYANQDGLGFASGSVHVDIEHRRKVFNLMTALYAEFSADRELYFVPIALTMDREYNYGMVETPVNPHSTVTVPIPSDMVHPQLAGYKQMADIFYSTWLAHYEG